MTLVDQHHNDVAIAPACKALEVSRATWYRNARRMHKSFPPTELYSLLPRADSIRVEFQAMIAHTFSKFFAAINFLT